MICKTCGYQVRKDTVGYTHVPATVENNGKGYPPGTNLRHKPRPIEEPKSENHHSDNGEAEGPDGLTDLGRKLQIGFRKFP